MANLRAVKAVGIVLGSLLTLVAIGDVALAQGPTIRYVQSGYAVPQLPQTTVVVAFPAAQAAGNLNVVIVGWNDASATVSSVTDSVGNPYALAVGPTVRPGRATQAIYFAKNIAGGANTVTVRFSRVAIYPDIRILEYSGLDPASPLHASAAATGSNASSSSGALTTTAPNVLLVAGNLVATGTSGPGAGFTSRMITSPDGDIAEDRIVTTAGSYSATAPLNGSGYWIMQLVAFKAAASTPDATPPTLAIAVPTTAPTYTTSTGTVTLGGTAADNVGVTQVSWANDRGGSGVATGTTSWSASGIALLAGTNVLTVTARDAAGNTGTAALSVTYTPPTDTTPPTVTITTPTTAATYTTTTSPLTLGGTAADNVGVTQVSWASNRGGSGVATGTTTWSASGIALLAGVNVLTVTARDAAGNVRTATLSVTYNPPDATPPTVSITAPTTAATYSTTTSPLTLGGTAADNVGVTQVSWASDRGGSGMATGTTTWSASGIALLAGVNVLTVTARDAAGNIRTATLSVTYNPPDATPPTVSLTAPSSGATVSGVVNVTAAASDNVGVAGVQFLLDGAALGAEQSTPPFSLSWNTGTVSNGTHTVAARARDAAGNTATSTAASVTVNNAAAATIRYVQGSYAVPQSPLPIVTVTFLAVQATGNLNVVVVGWNDASATVSSVTDSVGNAYVLAVSPTVLAGQASQAIYFAKNIAGGANTVTVSFSSAANYPDIRILEYGGLDPVDPLHGSATATGSSAVSSTGAVTTTAANVLLVAANLVATGTTGPGAGFTSRMITSPDGDIAEDRIVTSAGSYTASAPLSGAGFWIMQLVAFKAGGGSPSDTTPPTVTITAPTTAATYTTTSTPLTLGGTAADNVGVTQVSWTSDRGGSGVATGTTTWSASGIALLAGTNVLTVTARDAAGNAGTASLSVTYTPPTDTTPPTVTITTPTTAATYTTTTSPLTLGGTAADNVGVTQVSWASDRGGSGVATGTTTWSASGIALLAGVNVLTVTARDAAGNVRTATLSVTYNPPDATPPTVSITAPSPGATVSGVVNVTATASDNVGVAGVQFLLDGAPLGAEQSGPSFSLSWNTATASNGAHAVAARARDAAGNTTTSAPVSVTVNNGAAASIRYVQGSYAVPQSPQTIVTVAFPAAQAAGDLNVVVVGWNDASATVTSVTDSATNTYALAVGPTILAGQASQAIYFAKNIRSGANTVTVRFSTASNYPDIRILEYGGLDVTNPLHGSAVGTGSSAASSTGGVTTTAPNVLLVAANLVATGTSGPGAGFTSRMISVPDGDIAEDRIVTSAGTYTASAPLSGAGFWIMQLVAFSATPPPPDTAPPSVAINAPASGSTVSGTTTISATASDDVGVVGVQFFVDGQPLGAEVTSAPYSVAWDTTAASAGAHTLTAVARDLAGHATTSAPVSVTVAGATPAFVGQWAAPMPWPIVAVHASLLPTGEVLISDGQWLGNDARVWNPTTNTFTAVRNNNTNLFCSAHCHLADGRVLFAGGHAGAHTGVTDTNLFDATTRAWGLAGPMRTARWYPTVTTLPDGRVLVTAGEMGCAGCDAPLPEVYNPQTNTWTELSAASLPLPYYPHMHVLPDGRVLASSTSEHPILSHILDVNAQTWSLVDPDPVDGGSAAMYLPGKVVKSGTSYHPDDPVVPSATTTYVIDATQPSPRWRQTAPMAYARTYHVLTVLPDGTVLVTGGGVTTDAVGVSGGALPAELWSPVTETWTTMASMAASRLYHSTALLMPDARVLVMGGGRFNGVNEPTDQLSAQLYSPPYLFKGARPAIASAPASTTYGATITVGTPDAARIASVSLIRLGSVTHAINMDQRFVPLGFTAGSGALSVQAPANANLAPPGHYMLFIVDGNGIPSVAATIRIQ